MQKKFISVAIFVAASLTACAVGPDYKRPQAPMSDTFKEAQNDKWKMAEPADHVQRGNWWEAFGDDQLNALQAQLIAANQTVAAAEAAYRQARATAQAARSSFFPTLGVNVGATRGSSGSGNLNTTNENITSSSSTVRQNTATLDASWELDVWGRIRREVEAGEAGAQASAADLAAALLSAQAELAQDYFQLRVSDAQQELFDRTVSDYERSLQLTRNQYNVGVAGRAEVAQAEAQLKAAQAQAVDNDLTRAQLEHAIAILIGKAPADVTIARASFADTQPQIPLELPSVLLERRPDIAAAERRVVAANAQIGVTRAAWFPTLGLSASGGYRSSSFSDWFTVPNRFWSVGPTLAATLFDGGLRSAQSKEAVAAYDQTVANYRQTVLGGLQEVEDNLVALDRLDKELQYQQDAVRAAREALQLVNNQYKAGTVSYLNVITAETTSFNNERSLLQVRGRQYSASILLIKALGGGWSQDELNKQARN
ncbi:MAG: efflux system, outer rane lipoprotein NodT [Verrucomicrobiaceae bacterium]|nr:efflux system, outer rane lipoprotein NodT [Verrucomicrobiaceae bacterium]